MKTVKIGHLLFTKKSIFLSAFCYFLNGLSIGAFAFLNSVSSNNVSFLFMFASLFVPYILFQKMIKNNIVEEK